MTQTPTSEIRILSRPSNSTRAEKEVDSSPLASHRGRVITPVTGGTMGGALGGFRVGDENERARLINEISRVIRDPGMPETARTAGLTLIGWLARRMPGEQAHALGVPEARESERRIRSARQQKLR